MHLHTAKATGGGFEEAPRAAFVPPQAGEEIILGDASTQVPNLRASELFVAAWMAYRYPDATFCTDTHTTGTIAGYAGLWGPYGLDESVMEEWSAFFFPYRLRLVSLAPMHAARFERGAIRAQREAALMAYFTALGQPELSARIRIIDLQDSMAARSPTLEEMADAVPKGKAIARFTCPCCGNRLAITELREGYGVTGSGDQTRATCQGAELIERKLVREYPFAPLSRMLGLELSLFAAVRTYDLMPDTGPRRICLRDYSDPRGSISYLAGRYGPERLALSTRIYVKDAAGKDATGAALIAAAAANPAWLLGIMDTHEPMAHGETLTIVLP